MNTQTRYLRIELTKVQAEAAQLRKKLNLSNRHRKRVDKAYEDALLLATWHAAGIIPSRAYSKRFGFSQNRWQNAVALLKMARIIQRQRHWVISDLSLIEKRLPVPRGLFCSFKQTRSILTKHGEGNCIHS